MSSARHASVVNAMCYFHFYFVASAAVMPGVLIDADGMIFRRPMRGLTMAPGILTNDIAAYQRGGRYCSIYL